MNIIIRPTEEGDAPYIIEWLAKGDILQWFPMINQAEIEDAVRIWMAYAKMGASLTAVLDGRPVGAALLYIHPYKKLAHQCLFSIIVDSLHRSKGIGTELLNALIKLGKEKFNLEMLHLEVYEGNPAIGLYRKAGFKEFGGQKHFIKENGKYLGKILMQKFL